MATVPSLVVLVVVLRGFPSRMLLHHDAPALAGGAVAVLTEARLLELGGVRTTILTSSVSSRRFIVEAYRHASGGLIVYDGSGLRELWRLLGVPVLDAVSRRLLEGRAASVFRELLQQYRLVHVHASLLEPLFTVLENGDRPVMIKTVHDPFYVCPLRGYPVIRLGLGCGGVWRSGVVHCLGRVRRLGAVHYLRALRNISRLRYLAGVLNRVYDFVILPSMFLAELMGPMLHARFSIIRNPAPPDVWAFREKLVRPIPFTERGEYVLFLGRLSKEKGVHLLGRLAVSLRRAGIKLLIAGGGPLTGLAKRLEKRLDNVKYLGFVYGDEKSLLIANARALVFPSLVAENMPMSIAEALSLGTPVVAFNVGGQAELVRVSGGGVLGEAFDAGRLAELTVEVSTDASVFSELSLSGWRWASGNLAPSSYVARLEHVVDSIL